MPIYSKYRAISFNIMNTIIEPLCSSALSCRLPELALAQTAVDLASRLLGFIKQ